MNARGTEPSGERPAGRGERKEVLRRILLSRDWASLAGVPFATGLTLRTLVGFLQSPDPLVRWRAVEALGLAAAAARDAAPVEEVVKSLFWAMNDESGNLCRMAPEALGATLARKADLRAAFAHLLPQFAEEEPFEEGTLWALNLLVQEGWRPAGSLSGRLGPSLAHPSPRRRGLALRLARLLGANEGTDARSRPAEFEDYDLLTGQFVPVREPPPQT